MADDEPIPALLTDPAQDAEGTHQIGFIPCLAFAIGAMVGGGVFTLSGTAINLAGPAALVSYALAGLLMLMCALSFVYVAARAEPGETGYGPIAHILGRPWRFFVMWAFYLNAVLMTAFLSVSFGAYLHDYFIPHLSVTDAAIIMVVLVVALNLGPAALVGRAETWVVGIKIGLLLLFIGYGVASIAPSEFTPFSPHGSKGIFSTAALLFTAYTGFNVVTNMSGAIRDPEKNVPRAVIGSVLAAMVIYAGVIVAMLASGVTHFGPAGVGQAAEALMGHWGGQLIAFAACLSTLSGANAQVLGASELTLRMAVLGDVPPVVGVRTKAGFPWLSVSLIGVVALALALFTSIDHVVAVGNIAALAAMIAVNIAAFVLVRRPHDGGSRLIGGPVLPVVAGVACVAQFHAFDVEEIGVGLLALGGGMVVYALRHRGQRKGTRLGVAASMKKLETPLARALRRDKDPAPSG